MSLSINDSFGISSNWKNLKSTVFQDALTSSLKKRVNLFSSIIASLKSREIEDEDLVTVMEVILTTYASYEDHQSRMIVLQTIKALVERDLVLVSLSLVPRIESIVSQSKTMAVSDFFVILEWVNQIIPSSLSSGAPTTLLPDLIKLQCKCLYQCYAGEKKHRLSVAADKSTRNTLSLIFASHEDICSTYLDILFSTAISPPITAISLLGALAATAADLKVNQKPFVIISDNRQKYYNFFEKEILGSKASAVITRVIFKSFTPFFEDFLSEADFMTISTSIERALLRSPETVLVAIIPELIKSIPLSVDCSAIVMKHLTSPLLSSFKSSKPEVRSNSLKAFCGFLKKACNVEYTSKIAEEIVTPLRTNKITAADQRVLYARTLTSFSHSESLSQLVPSGLIAVASKETNEPALSAILSGISYHVQFGLINNKKIEKPVLDGFLSGLSDKRQNLRRFWIMAVGEIAESIALKEPNDAIISLFESVAPKLLDSWKEVNTNVSAAVLNKLIIGAFVITSITPTLLTLHSASITTAIAKAKIMETALTYTPKPSFLLSDSVYTKLVSNDDHLWIIKALSRSAASLILGREGNSSWALAFLYFITSASVLPETRTVALSQLTNVYLQFPEIVSQSVIDAIWIWIKQLENTTKKEASPAISYSVLSRLRLVLQAITPVKKEVQEDILKSQLVRMVIVTHHDLLSSCQDWITLCQRVSVDPGQLVMERMLDLQAEIKVFANNPDQTDRSLDASMRAAATLAFISPQTMAAFSRDMFVEDLDPSRLNGITQQDIEIWHTPEGVLCIDVLSKDKDKFILDKNTKDYATLKWEAEVRAELAKKQATQQKKKLTREEQIKVNEQMNKERAIRSRIQDAFLHVRRGVKLIHFLLNGVSNGPDIWFPAANTSLVAALKNRLSLLVGESGVEVFLELSSLISPRLGPVRRFVGIALLRAIGVKDLSLNLIEEPLSELVTRILYRLRFLSEQIPLDVISLVYIIPLLLLVFEYGGIECKDAESQDEQLMLALETLSVHTDLFGSTSLPRSDVLKGLIKLMGSNPSKSKASKDCLLGICRTVATNYNDEEIKILIQATIFDNSFVRAAVLEGIDQEFEISELKYSNELWIACHDEQDLNAKTAISIWEENDLEIDESTPENMLRFLELSDSSMRNAVASSIADSLEQQLDKYTTLFHDFLEKIMEFYRELARPPETIYDEYGMVIKSSLDQKDLWEGRSGIAITFKSIAPFFEKQELQSFINFLLNDGPLGDQSEIVRQQMQDAGIIILNLHAKDYVDSLMPMFEACLESKHTGSETQDRVKECAIILYGTIARHLDDDSRLPPIIDRLISTLKVPSENVQFAVSESMPPLVKRVDGERIGKYIDRLLNRLFTGSKYSERRGAAYGIAGIVKGLGISALSDYDIIRSLTDALDDKKDPKKRQGVQFAFETLSMSLGRYFEPYAIEILPYLLNSLGDMSPEVREATAEAAKEIMKHTTSYGIKQLIPLTLDSFNQTAWRAKKGSVELLGTMAYLDPRQLSESLSTIIPEIVGALNDTHKEVRKAANQSLQRFGEVISNPEIQNLVPLLLKAISDPTKYVDETLDALIKTAFVHYIDAPSLALIVYILHRGLRDRSASTKRKACQIVGNMASLTDSKDLIPYLSSLIAELEISMVDPVPATRATASRALGLLIEKLGEEQIPHLVPKLLNMLRAENNDGDRLGAAQALSEVVSSLGVRKLEELLPTVLKSVESPKENIRESFMNLMVFLPAAFGNNFSPYLSQVIPPILAGLADEIEPIRDIALRAGRLIVKNYATRAVDLLLPELERGLSDENYRIRLSSVELTGDLLFQITGVTGKNASQEQADIEDENAGGEVHKGLMEVLGQERRDRILASLYLCRSDVTALVRNAALDVWKSLVPNTPRTVKDILPTLSLLIIRRLSSADEDQKETASEALSELVRRFGENLLSQFLYLMESGAFSGDADAKQGVCVALSELVEASSPDVLELHEKDLMSFVRSAIIDSDANVREAAARAFDTLQDIFGDAAVDQVLPHLLNMLQNKTQSENALAALKEIMAVKSDVIFPVLIPILLASPITPFNARALGSLAEVAGPALYRRMEKILTSLVNDAVSMEAEEAEEINKSIDKILSSIEDEQGIELVMQIFVELARDEDDKKRAMAFTHVATFFSISDRDLYSEFASTWIDEGMDGICDDSAEVVKSAWNCMATLVSKLAKEDLLDLVILTSRRLSAKAEEHKTVSGFALPKGPSCVLPILSQGLMYGSSDQREYAARGMAKIVSFTPEDVLRPYVTPMVGPLIRTVGERFPPEVKVAILDTLAVLLAKVPKFLKPFLPQLQRTFVKSQGDTSSEKLQKSAQLALEVLNRI
ncbi:armadillo-type protein [Dipodascopsis uninucleata]